MDQAIRPTQHMHQGFERSRRPARLRGVLAVVAIDGIMGGLSLIGGINALSTGWLPVESGDGLGFLQFLAPVLPEMMITLGVIQLLLGYGLWRGLSWAWIFAVGFETIHVIADRSFALDKFVGIVIILGTLVYLLLPHVRASFGVIGAATRR